MTLLLFTGAGCELFGGGVIDDPPPEFDAACQNLAVKVHELAQLYAAGDETAASIGVAVSTECRADVADIVAMYRSHLRSELTSDIFYGDVRADNLADNYRDSLSRYTAEAAVAEVVRFRSGHATEIPQEQILILKRDTGLRPRSPKR